MNKSKNGKYAQYQQEKQAILDMIYDEEMDECRNRDIQSMDFILICPQRKLQIKHGKFNKKQIDVLPIKTLYKLARRGCNRNNRKGVNGVAIREQRKYFWARYHHQTKSLQSALKQFDTLKHPKIYNDYIEHDDDYIDTDGDYQIDY